MKAILTLAFAIISIVSFSQCPQDTITYGGAPAGPFSWSTGDPSTSGCTLCATYNTFNCWQFPDTMNGRMCVGGGYAAPYGDAAILLVNSCNDVLLDTCVTLGHIITHPLCLRFSLPANSQVCVFWDSTQTDSVGVAANKTTMPFTQLSTVQYSLDTCGGPRPVGLIENVSTHAKPLYFRMDTGKEAHVPLSPGLHIELSGDSRRLIMVR